MAAEKGLEYDGGRKGVETMAGKTEKTTGFIDLLYTNSVGFLRDVFQYAIPGLLFLSLLVLILHNSKYDILYYIPELKECELKVIVAYIALAIVLFSYICGQIIYSLSSLLFEVYGCIGFNSCLDEKLKRIRTELYDLMEESNRSRYDKFKNYLENGKDSNDKKEKKEKDDEIHLFYEISTFATAPEVHGRFIERYNIIMHFRKTLSGLFSLSAMIFFFLNILPLACKKTSDERCALFISTAIALLFVVFSLIFYIEYLRTKSAFYHRVFWSYFITKKDGG